jgi:hypothetical protein
MKTIREILPSKKRKLSSYFGLAKKAALIAIFAVFITTSLAFGQERYAWSVMIGYFLIVSSLLFIVLLDVKRHTPQISNDLKMLSLIYLLIAGVACFFMMSKGLDMLLEGQQRMPFRTLTLPLGAYWLPLSIAPFLAVLLLDMHIAFVIAIMTSLLAGVWLKDPFYTVYVIAGGITATFSCLKCKRRTCLLKASLLIANVNMLTVLMINLAQGQALTKDFFVGLAIAFMNGLLVFVLISALLPVLENIYGLVTNISLLEWLDLNQPLMRQLLLTAPGTYHHSLITGNLAESAAEAIGVNPLQARVGAYYHDIGKIKKPEYFIENQHGIKNVHDTLSPSMSSLIIISHVKEGVELAKQHKLPKIIRDIVEQHHGKSLITFFYQKAKNQSGDNGNVSKDDFRYPGPKPLTRVAALVMLADNVEAAARVLENPTHSRIAALVDMIVDRILNDKQLDECDLTLKNIQEIKKHFVYILSGIHHKRIDYPGLKLITHEDIHKKPTETAKFRP